MLRRRRGDSRASPARTSAPGTTSPRQRSRTDDDARQPRLDRRLDRWQHTPHGAQPTVEPELAEMHDVRRVLAQRAVPREHRDRDREVVGRATLGQGRG